MRQDVRALILAGGEGRRLRPLTYYMHKCMLPIGAKQKPVLQYVIANLKRQAVTNLVILSGYKSDQIRNYFKEGEEFGVRIRYVDDDGRYPGTGGALLNACRGGALDGSRTLLVHYGDILTDMDFTGLLRNHWGRNADLTLATSRNYRLPVGVVKKKAGLVVGFEEKPVYPIEVTVGVLAFRKSVIRHLEGLWAPRRHLDIMGDFVPHLIAQKRKIISFITEAFWYDVGTIEKYEKVPTETVERILTFTG